MKGEEVAIKIKKSVLVKIGIAFAVIVALVLIFLAYSLFFDLSSAVADSMDREALVAIESELNQNGYLTTLRRCSYEVYNSSGELLSNSDEYYSICVSMAQRKSASDFVLEKYSGIDSDVNFTRYS